MGLFLIHMIEYFELYWYGSNQETGPIRTVVTFMFSGKAYSMFALLFGVTFFLLLEKKGDQSTYTSFRFFWRMIVLACIGYLHSLIYPGDILQQLAVCGIFLLLVHRAPTWVLGLLVVVFLGRIASSMQFFLALRDASYLQPAFWEWSQKNFEVFANANFADFLKHTATLGQIPKWILILETGSMWNLMGLVVAGLLLARMCWFDRDFPEKVRARVFVGSGILAVGVHWLGKHMAPHFPELMPRWCFETVMGGLFNLAMVVLYMAAIPLLMKWDPAKRILSVLAPAGRMSLTCYVGQSLCFVPLFYGFGLGWYGSIGQKRVLLFALIAWSLQLIFAHFWFRHFRNGPLEGFWRWVTFLPEKGKTNRGAQP